MRAKNFIFTLFYAFLFSAFFISAAHAINIPKTINFGESLLLDARENTVNTDKITWTFSDGGRAKGALTNYKFSKPGRQNIRLNIQRADEKITQTFPLRIFSQKILLLTTENAVNQDIITEFKRVADLKNVNFIVRELDFEKLTRQLSELKTQSKNAFLVLSLRNANELLKLKNIREQIGLKNEILLLTRNSPSFSTRAARAFLVREKMQKITIAKQSALYTVFEMQPNDQRDISAFLNNAGHSAMSVNNTKNWSKWMQPVGTTVDFLLAKGLDDKDIRMLLLLPLVALLVAAAHNFIGVNVMNIYVPSLAVITFAALGWAVGLLSLAFVFIIGHFVNRLTSRRNLLALPRTAVILSAIAIGLLGWLAIIMLFGATEVSAFPLFVQVMLAERFIAIRMRRGIHTAGKIIAETLIVASIVYFIAFRISAVGDFFFMWPDAIFAILVGALLLGHYTGLRLSEQIRFRELLYDESEEE